MIPRVGAVAMILGVLVAAGCVRRQTLVIPPATMAVLPSPLNHADGDAFVMREQRELVARVKFSSVHRWGLSITARAEPGEDGIWPILRIELDGTRASTVTVDNRAAIPYWFNFVAEPGFADLKLSLANAAPSADGPALVIDGIEIVPL
jgi:hypothetical protein